VHKEWSSYSLLKVLCLGIVVGRVSEIVGHGVVRRVSPAVVNAAVTRSFIVEIATTPGTRHLAFHTARAHVPYFVFAGGQDPSDGSVRRSSGFVRIWDICTLGSSPDLYLV
jgi:hypothetical protein